MQRSLGQTNGGILLQSNVQSRTKTRNRSSVSGGGRGEETQLCPTQSIFLITLLAYLFIF